MPTHLQTPEGRKDEFATKNKEVGEANLVDVCVYVIELMLK